MSESKRVYILDARSIVGNCATFWRPDGMGYTTQLEEAGLYDPEMVARQRITDLSVPEDMARACSVTHVRVERLRAALDIAGIKWPTVNMRRR